MILPVDRIAMELPPTVRTRPRGQVGVSAYGCSPGRLVLSLVLSGVVTILIDILIRLL